MSFACAEFHAGPDAYCMGALIFHEKAFHRRIFLVESNRYRAAAAGITSGGFSGSGLR
ncbi:hypothetical protein CBM2592_B100372 [Cupriavidus taiwanensis]|nr:hypothetical protein CBM2592_B100372 [Cupriavidus taiwanensis]SOY98158.1 hypothetical protein CBM2591_B80373 [Cupriavidus taiwanensis]SOZ77210.1 hypothetical protein CBM2617_U10029 [Cupriavidus taiwanensis]SOZ85220.1 hypothetical protein CBM2618_B130050 [Cupriavidus taiwanensis]SPD57302.1 protein of unknown function [Cupriavidus taiwanensis]